MKKLALAYMAFSLVLLPGCGKKDEAAKKKKDEKKSVLRRLFSQSETDANKELPIYTAEKEAAEDEVVSDFAFVDEDELSETKEKNKGVKVASDEDFDAEDETEMPVAEDKEEELLASADSDKEDLEDLDFERVQFEFNGRRPKRGQDKLVENDIETAKKAVSQGKEIVISGHTCQMGAAAHNLALSQTRAEAVKKEMVKAGVPGEKIKTVGYGYESPLVWTDKTEREAKIKELSPNRRAEISIK